MTEREPNELMSAAADSLRAFNRRTRTEQLPDGCLTAPDAYWILGSAAELANAMPQALAQLSDALQRSLTVFDVYDRDGPLTMFDDDNRDREPADSITKASHALSAAAEAFALAAQHISDAQAAIIYQGVNEDDAGNLRRRPDHRHITDSTPGARFFRALRAIIWPHRWTQ